MPGFFGRFFGFAQKPARRPLPKQVNVRAIAAKYDIAQTTVENRRYYANADGLSANAANSPEVRKKARDRARYEVANNTYADGIVSTLANDVIGTGPRLQLSLRGRTSIEARKATEQVEWDFAEWARAIGLAEKLRLARETRAVSGEAFLLLVTNPGVDHAVKLDVVLVEPEQIATPDRNPLDARSVDGIEFDAYGNPSRYHVLDEHPGEMTGFGSAWGTYRKVDAKHVIHWFRRRRPGQARGMPEIGPSLRVLGEERRFTHATIAAAETAAQHSGVVQSDASPDEADDVEPMDTLDVEQRMLTVMPRGWKLSQLKAEHPGTTYPAFKREMIASAARPWSMPYNIAACDSSSYNYSSGRLDHKTYYKAINVDRSSGELTVIDRLFVAYHAEASLRGIVPVEAGAIESWDWAWFWDGDEHVDPVKEANAQKIRLEIGTTTYAEEFAREGKDYETQFVQQAREQGMRRRLGLPAMNAEPAPAPVAEKVPVRRPDDEDEDDADA